MGALRLGALLAVAALLVLASVSCQAVVQDTQLTGTIGTLDLHAESTWTGAVWHYSYALTYTQSTIGGIIKTFQVENPNQVAYQNPTNTGNFTNPTFDPQAYSIDWLRGTLAPGQTVTYSYDSAYAPVVGQTFTLTVDAGQNAGGITLGMSVPEPGSFVALGTMLGGALLGIRRRRR